MKTLQSQPFVTRLSLTMLLLSALSLGIATVPKAHGAALRSNDFIAKQKGVYKANNRSFNAMTQTLNRIVNDYVNSDEKTYWSDAQVVHGFQAYLDNLTDYVVNFRNLVKASKKAAPSGDKRTRKAITLAQTKIRRCEPNQVHRAKAKLSAARGARKSGVASYRSLHTAVDAADSHETELIELSVRIAHIINGESEPPTYSDGYMDDAVYEFGSKTIILNPNPTVDFDPTLFDPLAESLFAYDDAAIDVYESPFARKLNRAFDLARRASWVSSRC